MRIKLSCLAGVCACAAFFAQAQIIDHAAVPDAVLVELGDASGIEALLVDGEPAAVLARGQAQAMVRAHGPATLQLGGEELMVEPFVSRATATANVTVRVAGVPGMPGHASAVVRGKAGERVVIAALPPGGISDGSIWMRTTLPATIPVLSPPGSPFELLVVTESGALVTETIDTASAAEEVAEEADESGSDKWWWIGGGLIAAGGAAVIIADDDEDSSSMTGGSGSGTDGGDSGSGESGGGGGSGSDCSEGDFIGTWIDPDSEAEKGYQVGITFSGGGSAFMFADSDGGGEWSLDGCTISVSSGVDPFENCSTTVSPGATSMTLCGTTLVKQ